MTKTNLYRHYDADGKLLYVGISLSAVERLNRHKRGKSSWFSQISRVEIEAHETRSGALKAEREAIENESPEYNKIFNGKTERPKPKGRQKRKGYTVSLTEQEKARVDRLLELKARNGRQQFMAMVDDALAELDPEFLKASKAAEE